MAAMDKAARLAAEAEKKRQEQAAKASRLDPVYPFRVKKFDVRFFTAKSVH